MAKITLEWKTRPVKCNICDIDDASLLWTKDGFSYVKCSRCSLIYVNPQLLDSEIKRIYEIGFASKSESKPISADFSTYEPVLRWAAQYRRTMKLLDIGCFKGSLLLAARRKGWHAAGTEISAQAAEYARQKEGLDVFLGSLSDAKYPDSSFDVVIMQDVVEHLSNPKEYFTEIFRIMRPGGGLYIETPNCNSITRRVLGKDWSVFVPWHQYYFTAGTLQRLLEKTGFAVPRIRCFGVSPISCYNALSGIQERQEIVSASRRCQSFIELKAPYLKRMILFSRSLSDAAFGLMSSLGVHVGTRMTIFAEKVSKG